MRGLAAITAVFSLLASPAAGTYFLTFTGAPAEQLDADLMSLQGDAFPAYAIVNQHEVAYSGIFMFCPSPTARPWLESLLVSQSRPDYVDNWSCFWETAIDHNDGLFRFPDFISPMATDLNHGLNIPYVSETGPQQSENKSGQTQIGFPSTAANLHGSLLTKLQNEMRLRKIDLGNY